MTRRADRTVTVPAATVTVPAPPLHGRLDVTRRADRTVTVLTATVTVPAALLHGRLDVTAMPRSDCDCPGRAHSRGAWPLASPLGLWPLASPLGLWLGKFKGALRPPDRLMS